MNQAKINSIQNIDEVIIALDEIIDNSIVNNDFLGIFAYVYRRTTAQVKQGILDKRFEDNHRMEMFDVIFGKLYLDAYWNYQNNLPTSVSWEKSFKATSNTTIIQHILMGMNAHINLDLGIAAAHATDGKDINEIKKDFLSVNQLLWELVNEMQYKISSVSRLMFLLDWIGKRNDELITNFSIKKARDHAWNFACELSGLSGIHRQDKIDRVDQKVALLTDIIQNPPGKILKFALSAISLFEEKDIKKIINHFRGNQVIVS